MGKSAKELMALRFGGRSVAENIDRAVAAGRLVAGEDGSISLLLARRPDTWAKVSNRPSLTCQFLMTVMFKSAFAQTAVPYGCRTCFKVKAVFKSMRELVAGWGLAKKHPFSSKWGIDLDNNFSQSVYAGYYYVAGLDEARSLYWILRDAYANDPKLGPDIDITIKRGCSEYEAAIGPSDSYEFNEDQADLEAHLKALIQQSPPEERSGPPPLPLALWIDFAFRTGDDTYLDFTGGRRLRPKAVSYDPGEPPARASE